MITEDDYRFKNWKEIKYRLFNCPSGGYHQWTMHQWVASCHVWFEKCSRCGAVVIWAGNNIIYKQGFVWEVFSPKTSFVEEAQSLYHQVLREVEQNG